MNQITCTYRCYISVILDIKRNTHTGSSHHSQSNVTLCVVSVVNQSHDPAVPGITTTTSVHTAHTTGGLDTRYHKHHEEGQH